MVGTIFQRNKPSAKMFVLLLILALLNRILISSLLVFNDTGGDSSYYLAMAQNIKIYHIFGSGSHYEYFRVPGYPFFIYLGSLISGKTILSIYIIQTILSAVSAYIIYVTIVNYNRPVAEIASICVVISPFGGMQDLRILQESLVTFFLVIITSLSFYWRSNMSFFKISILGILCAALTLTRDIYFPLFFAFALFFQIRFGKKFFIPALVASAVFLTCLTPWALRNKSVSGDGLFLSRGVMGLVLWFGSWHDGHEAWRLDWNRGKNLPDKAVVGWPDGRDQISAAFANQDDRALARIALNNIETHPMKVAINWAKRVRLMWIGTRSDLVVLKFSSGSLPWVFFKVTMFALNIFVLIFGTFGILRSALLRLPLGIFAIPVIYTFAVYIPFYNEETRYSNPVLPVLYIFLAFSLLGVYEWLFQKESKLADRVPSCPRIEDPTVSM